MPSRNLNSDLVGLLELQLAAAEADARKIKDALAVIRRRGWDPEDDAHVRLRTQRERSGDMGRFVLRVLEDNPRRAYDAIEVFGELKATGWEPAPLSKDPLNSVRTALANMVNQGRIRRVRKGVYQALEPVAPLRPLEPALNGHESPSA